MVKNSVKKLSLALYEIASQENKLSLISENIKNFALEFFKVATSNKSLHLDLLNKANQKEILTLILDYIKADKIFIYFIYGLVDTNKLNLLNDFLNNWEQLQRDFQGYQKVEVITAEPLSNEQEKQIKDRVKKILGEKIFLDKRVDEKIIAGLIVRSKNFEFNDSILGRLNNISKNIKGALFNE